MAVVDHVLIVVLLATVLPVAMNASRVLRNVHSAKVFTTVLNRMKRMKSLMNTTDVLSVLFKFDEKQTKIFLLIIKLI